MQAKSNSSKGKILLVDDDPGLLRLLSIRLRAEGFDVEAVESAHKALASVNRFGPDLVITDLRMDKMDGIGLLKELQTRSPGLRVIIITAHGTIPDAVTATQHGAFGFLTKPIDKDELLSLVERALMVSGTVEVEEDWAAEIITRNAAMKEVMQQAKMVAATDARVLITGDSGTGKELIAKAIHKASPRHNKPFTAINCSAMAENLLESELFGHEKGAFTGASRSHEGLFQAAEGGTLLLDEIGDTPGTAGWQYGSKAHRCTSDISHAPGSAGPHDAGPLPRRSLLSTERRQHQIAQTRPAQGRYSVARRTLSPADCG
jgi:two-component system response regulator GlrR